MRLIWGLPVATLAVVVAGAASSAADSDARSARWKVKPPVGDRTTTFRFRYYGFGDEGNSGDYIHLSGPPHTRCRGEIAVDPVGYVEGKQTIYLGPRAPDENTLSEREFPIYPVNEKGRAFKRWCRGKYRGHINYQTEDPKSVVLGRFAFRVR